MSADVLRGLVAKDRVTAEDVLRVRASVYPDMAVSREEAEAFFEVNDTARSTCPEWRMLFVEALTDYTVRQSRPAGYVDAAMAEWLVAHIRRDGRIKSDTELELLIHILEEASDAPSALSRLALQQVVAFAMTDERRAGDGPTLTGPEVRNLRRVLYANVGAEGAAAVSREEAEVLLALNDAARERPNDPAWKDLFVHAVGAAVLMGPGYHSPSRDDALRQDAWLHAPGDGVGTFLSKMFAAARSGAAGSFGLMGEETPIEARNREVAAAAAEAAPLTGDEGAWLAARLGRDGVLDENEIALLMFISQEASQIHPDLQPLIDRARVLDQPAPVAFGRRVSRPA